MQSKSIKRSFAELTHELKKIHRRQSTLIVGIDGVGGAGKSTFARSLKAAHGSVSDDATIVRMDDFFRPSSQQRTRLINDNFVNGGIDWKRLRDQVILPIKENQPGGYQRYDWPSCTLQEWHVVDVGGILIIEGVYANRRELALLYDYRIWIECPRPLRLSRGLARDGEQARDRWESDWMPTEDRYIERHRPWELADLIVDGSGESGLDLDRFFVAVQLDESFG